MTTPAVKSCVRCGRDVSSEKRFKDPQGRYFCAPCYQAAQRPAPALVPTETPAPDAIDHGIDGEIELALASRPAESPAPRRVRESFGTTSTPLPSALAGGGLICPCCLKPIPAGGKICTGCGIMVPSGRPVITSLGRDEDSLYGTAETTIRWLAWILRFGLYPIASEAYAVQKPIVIWAIAILTTLTSFIYFVAIQSAPENRALTQLMLWPPHKVMSDQAILALYRDNHDNEIGEVLRRRADDPQAAWAKSDPDSRLVQAFRSIGADEPDGEFRWYQLFTNVFLHDPGSIFALILHLGGNMLFLLIFGTRVNALVGNFKMALLYPLLGAIASASQLLFSHSDIPRPALGASGAIMGLAGMYLIFFPVHRVYMAIWLKLFWGVPTWLKIWPVRGFWVLAFYIAFDVLGTLLRSADGVAHWAHLGGFIGGMVIALVMLIARLQHARHADLLSVLLGRYAWPLIGKPQPLIRGIVVG